MFIVDHGLTIVLTGKERPGFEDFAGLVYFSSANLAAMVAVTLTVAIPLAVIEIKQSGIVAEGGVAGNPAGAAAFGIAGMTAGDDDFQLRAADISVHAPELAAATPWLPAGYVWKHASSRILIRPPELSLPPLKLALRMN